MLRYVTTKRFQHLKEQSSIKVSLVLEIKEVRRTNCIISV